MRHSAIACFISESVNQPFSRLANRRTPDQTYSHLVQDRCARSWVSICNISRPDGEIVYNSGVYQLGARQFIMGYLEILDGEMSEKQMGVMITLYMAALVVLAALAAVLIHVIKWQL